MKDTDHRQLSCCYCNTMKHLPKTIYGLQKLIESMHVHKKEVNLLRHLTLPETLSNSISSVNCAGKMS